MQALNAANNQGIQAKAGENLAVSDQIAKQNGLQKGDYVNFAEFKNFDIADKKDAGNRVGM